MQGMRDTLFNFNHAYANYLCYQSAGGDVRLRSYPFGHNATPVVPDPGVRPVPPNPNPEEFTPPLDAYDNRCASLGGHDAGLAFFDEYVKGIKGAADVIPHQICLSLASGDGVLVDEVTAGHAGVEVDIAPTTLIAGVPDVPVAVNLGITAGPDGDVLGGIPRLEVDVQPLMPGMPGEPVIFAGIGRASAPGAWELVDNQIMPMRGIGSHDIDLAGIGERLQPGDQLALLFYGGHNQYALTGSLNLAQPSPIPVTVTGKIWVPILGPLPAAP
jgi:ABC-2 type transport system ATP-binding protein